MSHRNLDVSAAVTLSPEGELRLSGDYIRTSSELTGQSVDFLAEAAGAELVGATVVVPDVERLVRPMVAVDEPDIETVTTLCRSLSLLASVEILDTNRDAVITPGASVDWAEGSALVGAHVYPQFQHWMNGRHINEALARDIFTFMRLAFTDEEIADYSRGYEERHSDDVDDFEEGGLRLRGIAEDFSFWQLDPKTGGTFRTSPNWQNLDLITHGSCACLGTAGGDRADAILLEETTHLYEIGGHNIDRASAALSMYLGLARMAWEAQQLEPVADILPAEQWTLHDPWG